ncbi:transporter substrate-binding domain-containing protein [Paucibacter sp. APW11]|uniref:Transporter substrate-binding domain-containing protein n=1 Tax=Roseateles aquae TaxID=3077235 RepID=A0ABU3P864_9BURK|nr:transporter substrate-binding domain-containing protein [Paucibacter sp. APW11]MDT8998763.1 transporter substrate-binding domain-containing protein [Paucibacter sp. APW11]
MAPPCLAAETELQWVAGELPPFAWIGPGGAPQGYASELALAMAQKLGRKPELQFFPWARAVRMTAEGENFGVFPLARTPDREAGFRWLIPLMRVDYSFFVKRSQGATGNLLELRRQRVGVLRGSPIIKNLQAEGFKQITEAKDYKDLLRMLQQGMIAAIYAGTPMLQAAIDQAGLSREDFLISAQLGSAELYMGASLKLSEAEAQRWLRAYEQLQAEGTVKELQQRYLK